MPRPWVGVPTVSRFCGMTISMYFKDHSPPHFHVWSQGRAGSVRIHPVEVIDGKVDRKQFALIERWARLHRIELEENWQRARNHGTLKPIELWK